MRKAGTRPSLRLTISTTRRQERLRREQAVLAHHPSHSTAARANASKARIALDAPRPGHTMGRFNETWGTDMTQTSGTAGPMSSSPWDTPTRKSSANRFEALEPVRQTVHRCFGGIAPGVTRGLKAASRSWLQLHVGRFPGRNRMPTDRGFALHRATARRQSRRARHPNLEGEPAVGEDLRHHQKAASRARRLRTKPGSSLDTAIVPQSKCESINAALIRTQRQTMAGSPGVSKPGRSTTQSRGCGRAQ